jgi:hypothetical protein
MTRHNAHYKARQKMLEGIRTDALAREKTMLAGKTRHLRFTHSELIHKLEMYVRFQNTRLAQGLAGTQAGRLERVARAERLIQFLRDDKARREAMGKVEPVKRRKADLQVRPACGVRPERPKVTT